MKAVVAWWDLDGTGHSVDSLGGRLREGDALEAWARVPGLLGKFWIADRQHNRWGAVMLWEHEHPGAAALPPNEAARLLGGPPAERAAFDVEAAVRGVCDRPLTDRPAIDLASAVRPDTETGRPAPDPATPAPTRRRSHPHA
ncbi:hypothetical protein [Streptomyces sp. NPDC058657]|uniref:hypothetical protein n=1 Tax=unclassified Streptomyces TaxID=2593676 RepID=UPI00365AAA16